MFGYRQKLQKIYLPSKDCEKFKISNVSIAFGTKPFICHWYILFLLSTIVRESS